MRKKRAPVSLIVEAVISIIKLVLVEDILMRKKIINPIQQQNVYSDQKWLDIEKIAVIGIIGDRQFNLWVSIIDAFGNSDLKALLKNE